MLSRLMRLVQWVTGTHRGGARPGLSHGWGRPGPAAASGLLKDGQARSGEGAGVGAGGGMSTQLNEVCFGHTMWPERPKGQWGRLRGAGPDRAATCKDAS